MTNDKLSDELARLELERERVFREIAPAGPRPLVQLRTRTAMFGPLAVLIAILPGLYGLTNWDLTPPGPWWGLRGVAVIDDGLWVDQTPLADGISGLSEANSLRWVALSPPLYAWLEGLFTWLSPSRSPVTTVLPAYFAGVLLVYLVYVHGKTWVSPGAALFGAFIFGFSQTVLSSMQRAGPATLAAITFIGAIEFYSRHIQAGERGRIRGRILYAMGCGACIGLSLMSVGLIALAILPLIGFHQLALNAGESPMERTRHWYEAWRLVPGLFYGMVSVTVAMVIAAPWHVWMTNVHPSDFWLALIEPTRPLGAANRGPLGHLIETTPVFLCLAIFIAVRTIRQSLFVNRQKSFDESILTLPAWVIERSANESEKTEAGLLLWTIWAFIALTLSVYWPLGPQNTLGLLLTAAISLLAGHAARELAQRRLSARMMIWVTPATFFCLVWKLSPGFRRNVREMQQSLPGPIEFSPAVAMVLLVSLWIVAMWLVGRLLARWAAVRDGRSRILLAINLGIFFLIQSTLGLQEIGNRQLITKQLLELRQAIVRYHARQPIERIYVVGSISPNDLARMRLELPDTKSAGVFQIGKAEKDSIGVDPAGRLRFILHTALPLVVQDDLRDLDLLAKQRASSRLVILVGHENRLSSAMQMELGLEEIHPGIPNIFQAFAGNSNDLTRFTASKQNAGSARKPVSAKISSPSPINSPKSLNFHPSGVKLISK
jgi:hypothetical protein